MEIPTGEKVPHLLFVTSPLQGHINPARRLAARVAAANPTVRVTFSATVSTHRRLFPSLELPDEEVVDVADGVLHVPYSDGFDQGFDPKVHDAGEYKVRSRETGRETLSAIVERLAARGTPVTRVVFTFLVGWVLDVARVHGVPAALFWIQPATVFAVYYHYFHGHGELLAAACANGPDRDAGVELPGLPLLKSRELPSIVSLTSPEQPLYKILDRLRDLFAALDEHRLTVLVNSFDALEESALRAVPQLDLVAVGPVVPDRSAPLCTDLFQCNDTNNEYMEWLDTKPTRSVVYVAFGTLISVNKRQEVEIRSGLETTGRPYLWVARRGGSEQGEQDINEEDVEDGGNNRMVVEWCDQMRVLAHPAVGCFVTHCGWNSTLESITCGVPIVAVPHWIDQPTVAWLVEECAGVGVRARVDGEGVVERGDLQHCVDTVMGEGDRGVQIRARAQQWREWAREAVANGGMSERNIQEFVSRF